MKSSMKFSDKFTKSIAWLLTAYDTAPLTLNTDIFKRYMNEFVENGEEIFDLIEGNTCKLKSLKEYCRDFEIGSFSDKMDYISSKNYLFSIFLLLYDFGRCQNEYRSIPSLNILDEMITKASFLNGFIASLIQDYDFEEYGKLDFDSAYLPNIDLSNYLENIYKTDSLIRIFKSDYNQKDLVLDEDLVRINHKLDCEYIDMGYSFVQMQAILLLIEHSMFYDLHIRAIAKEIILLLKDILVDARIKKVVIDNALLAGIHRTGIKKTTFIMIFFALGNMDRYCLRIDFPHDDKSYIHFNLHEPKQKTAMPIEENRYQEIVKKYGEQEDLFFYFSKRYWFRYDFMNKLSAKYSDEKDCFIREGLTSLFEEQAHLCTFKNDYNKQEITDFIVDFSSAMCHLQIPCLKYGMTDSVDIQKELKKIKLRDILLNAIELYQRIEIEEKILNKDCCEAKEILKKVYIQSLSSFYEDNNMPFGTVEELQELDMKQIFLLIEMLCE